MLPSESVAAVATATTTSGMSVGGIFVISLGILFLYVFFCFLTFGFLDDKKPYTREHSGFVVLAGVFWPITLLLVLGVVLPVVIGTALRGKIED